MFYRPLMKLAHKFGWHHMREVYPDGDTMLWCDWCGIRIVTKTRKQKEIVDLIFGVFQDRAERDKGE